MPPPNGPSRTAEPAASAKSQRRTRPQPKPVTRRRLENIATFYLQRFASTAANLKKVLMRRAVPALRVHGGDRSEVESWVNEIVARFERSGVVDDTRYAAGRVASLRRLGKGPGKIRIILRTKGVAPALIEQLLAETAEDPSGADATLEAALAYARRRRLGPFGNVPADAEAKRAKVMKDLATLARAGFPYAVAKRVISDS